jgi:hypothetical protein
MTPQFEADLYPDTHQPRVRFNFENGWSASLVLLTNPEGPKSTEAMLCALAAAPTGKWGTGKTELGSQEAFADEAIAWLAAIAARPQA